MEIVKRPIDEKKEYRRLTKLADKYGLDIAATYEYDVLEGFLLIEDKCEKNRLEVLFDMDRVLKNIRSEIGDEFKSLKILNKDRDNVWNGVIFKVSKDSDDVMVIGLALLNETEVDQAVLSYLDNAKEWEEEIEDYIFTISEDDDEDDEDDDDDDDDDDEDDECRSCLGHDDTGSGICSECQEDEDEAEGAFEID
jgi:hypothetical protein